MASGLNKVMLMGNITRALSLRQTPSGQTVTTVGIAVNRRLRTAEGEQREDVVFVDCDAWGKTAEMVCQYFAKGKPILIEGRLLPAEAWLDKNTNEPRCKNKVIIENFFFVDSKGGGGASGEGGSQSNSAGGNWAPRQNAQPRQNQPAPAASAPAPSPSAPPMEAEDIPF